MTGFESLYSVRARSQFLNLFFSMFSISSLLSTFSPIPLALVADHCIIGEMLPPSGRCEEKH